MRRTPFFSRLRLEMHDFRPTKVIVDSGGTEKYDDLRRIGEGRHASCNRRADGAAAGSIADSRESESIVRTPKGGVHTVAEDRRAMNLIRLSTQDKDAFAQEIAEVARA